MDRNMKGGGSLDHINEQGPLFANWQWLVVFLQLVADLAVYQGGMSSHGPYSVIQLRYPYSGRFHRHKTAQLMTSCQTITATEYYIVGALLGCHEREK